MSSLLKAENEKVFLLGNEAIVRGAIESGVGYVTAYPGTPSSEIIDTMYRLRNDTGIRVEYAVNEKVSVEVAAAVSNAGIRSLVSMKHVGLNVAADAFMTLSYVGVKAGMVIVCADDPSLHSSQNEQDNRFYARMALVPMLEPSTPQEAYEMTCKAFELSESFGTPCLLRTTTRVNHARGVVKTGFIPPNGGMKKGEFKKDPFRYVVVPMVGRMLRVEQLKRWESLTQESNATDLNFVEGSGKIGVITSGVSYLYVKDAIEELGLNEEMKIAKLGMTSPFPDKFILNFLRTVDKVIVVEELEPYLEEAIRSVAQVGKWNGVIVGKEFIPRHFELNVPIVKRAFAKFLDLSLPQEEIFTVPSNIPARPPNLCPGCPHRATYYSVKKTFGRDALYPTDIGCYTLGLLPPLQMADFLICMGSSVSTGGGFSIALDNPVVAFIGDSTFFHAGITGLINCVTNGHKLLLVILDNSTTAMTGHQPHPGASMTVEGACECKVDVKTLVEACGVKACEVVNPLNVTKTIKTFEKIKNSMDSDPGVYVVISKSPCPLLERRVLRKKQKVYFFVDDTCDGCNVCLEELACPAFVRTDDRVSIDELLCIGCAVCAQICNSIKPRKIEK